MEFHQNNYGLIIEPEMIGKAKHLLAMDTALFKIPSTTCSSTINEQSSKVPVTSWWPSCTEVTETIAQMFGMEPNQMKGYEMFRFEFLCQILDEGSRMNLSELDTAIMLTIGSHIFLKMARSANFDSLGDVSCLEEGLNYLSNLISHFFGYFYESYSTCESKHITKTATNIIDFFNTTFFQNWSLYQYCIAFNPFLSDKAMQIPEPEFTEYLFQNVAHENSDVLEMSESACQEICPTPTNSAINVSVVSLNENKDYEIPQDIREVINRRAEDLAYKLSQNFI